MKYLIVYTILFIIRNGCLAQDTLNAGAYLSVMKYKSNTPSLNNLFNIKKRSIGDISWNGGNDFKVEVIGNNIKKEK